MTAAATIDSIAARRLRSKPRHAGHVTPQRVQPGEVERAPQACADDGGEGPAPEGQDAMALFRWRGNAGGRGLRCRDRGGGRRYDRGDGLEEGLAARLLLQAGFEEVGRLEEGGG